MDDSFFNPDPDWIAELARYEPVIQAIAYKATLDSGLRADVEQEARMAVLTVRPERIHAAQEAQTPEARQKAVDAYVHNVARNSIYSYLQSHVTGSWRHGRTVWRTSRSTGERYKVHEGPRYSSFDHLASLGFQVDRDGETSWDSREHGEDDAPMTARELRERRAESLHEGLAVSDTGRDLKTEP